MIFDINEVQPQLLSMSEMAELSACRWWGSDRSNHRAVESHARDFQKWHEMAGFMWAMP